VKNPDTGAHAPDDGASDDRATSLARPGSEPGDRNGTPFGHPDARQGAKPPRKRRKRRRGGKVFVRAGSEQATARPGTQEARPVARGEDPGQGQAENPGATAQPLPSPAKAPQPRQGSAPAGAQMRVPGSLRSSDLPFYAALDLGTNNCRLLVAVPGRPGQFRVVDAFSRIVRLGEGLTASGLLSDAAMDRAVEALGVCADKLRSRKVRSARLIATEACRSAANGAAFIARVEAETGLRLEIIDRKTEARLAVSGCGSLVERGTQGVVLFDIGGGSSEIALVDLSRHRSPRLANHIVSWTSLPVGVVSLAERFGGRHVTREVFAAMVDDVATMLERFEGRGRLAHVASGDRFHLLGTSGTVTTLAGVHLGLERYDRRRVDGLWLDGTIVDEMIERLLGWEFEERVANPCIGADRADLVLAGCAILEAIRRFWPSPRLRVADRGLREGILTELMADDGVWRRNRRRPADQS
jgi:exopolyphosphatase/guanosine-5'-triphosphate,3'-diphosphate pyrophosphatase